MARKQYPSDRQAQFMLRMPDGMRERIKDAAQKNNRSMNAEIVARLDDSFDRWPNVSLPHGMVEAVHDLPEEYRDRLEREISDFALQRVVKFVHETDISLSALLEIVSEVIKVAPKDKRERILRIARRLFVRYGASIPDELWDEQEE